jgi:hypothetical protein
MFMHPFGWNRIALLATLAVFPLFAACGGEEAGESGKSSGDSGNGLGGTLVCIAYLLVSGNDECLTSVSSSSSGSSSNAVRYVLNNEFEPNDDWLNANPLVMESSPSPDGFIVDGDLSDASDLSDTFSFARKTARNFRFKLCSSGHHNCNEFGEIDTLTAYIDILDAYGNVLASSQAASRNLIETRIEAGITYYVRVVAGDTMAATVSYHLTANEYE